MSTYSMCGRPWGRVSKVVLLVVAFCLLWSSGAKADLYIHFWPDVEGESNYGDGGWSDISSVSWDLRLSYGGQIELGSVSWTQYMDTSFPTLFHKCANVSTLDSAQVDFVFNDQTYFLMSFEEVQITSLSTGGGSDEEKIIFNGTFDYRSIYMEYNLYDQNGDIIQTVSAAYDKAAPEGSAAALASIYALGISGPSNAVVPVPPSVLLLGTGLLGLGAAVSRRRKSS